MKSRIFERMPSLDYEEAMFLENISKDLNEEQLQTFLSIYNGKRQNNDTILIGGLIGLLGVGGVQRFMVGQIGMGILFLLTFGLCYIGTIVDLVNYKKLAFEHNQQKAFESMQITKSMGA